MAMEDWLVQWLPRHVERILSDHAEEWFEKYYATYPLVMKKYELLRDLIENEMGVKLK